MQKDYNEILMSLNIKGWCHSMEHETEDDIQDAYMIALERIMENPKYPSYARTSVYNYFKRKYKDTDIKLSSLQEFLSNNSEYKNLAPTEIDEYYKINKDIHYNDLVYFILDHFAIFKSWKEDAENVENLPTRNQYIELLYLYCGKEEVMIKYIEINNIPLTRELVILLIYLCNNDFGFHEIAKIFNISNSRVSQILARIIRKIRWLCYNSDKFNPYSELFY